MAWLVLAYLAPVIGMATWLSSAEPASGQGGRQWLRMVGTSFLWPLLPLWALGCVVLVGLLAVAASLDGVSPDDMRIRHVAR